MEALWRIMNMVYRFENALRRVFRRTHRRRETVVFDDNEIMRTMIDGRTETVRWDALEEVFILTSDRGPFVGDVFWILIGKSGGCAIPADAEGVTELIERLQELPGFDNEAVVYAMGSVSEAKFACWKRPNT